MDSLAGWGFLIWCVVGGGGGIVDEETTFAQMMMVRSTTSLVRLVSLLAVVMLSIWHLLLAHRASSTISISITTVNRGERTTNLAPLVRHPSQSTKNANSEDENIPPTNIVVVGDAAGGITDDHAVVHVLRNAFMGNDDTGSSKSNTANNINITITIHNQLYRRELLEPSMLHDVVSKSNNVLWIVIVRPPCHWADTLLSMQDKRCSMMSENDVKDDEDDNGRSSCAGREFASEADYYRMPWYDVALSDYEGGDDDDDVYSVDYGIRASIIPNSASNNINRQTRYDDIFDMRQRRLLLLKQVMEVMPRRVKVLRLGEFDLNPNVLVQDLVKEYGFTISSAYKPSLPTVNPQQSDSINNVFSCMDYAKWKEAQQRIDWSLEGYFGHNQLDCHLCRDSTTSATAATNIIIPPTSIYVLGERNSGTTFAANTLSAAFESPNIMGSKSEKFSVDIPILLHKHMFRHDTLSTAELNEIKQRTDILWVMVIRSPCDWVEAMFRKPYHICPPKKLVREDGITPYCGPMSDPKKKLWLNQNFVTGISFIEFLTMEWNDWAESVPFMRDVGKEEDAGVPPTGVEMSISKVSMNYTYPSGVFGLRKHKLEIMKQILEIVPRNVKFVNLKEMERSPELLIQSLVREFHLHVKGGYVSQPPSRVTHSTTCFTPSEWDVAQGSIDWHTEAEFGYSPFECRMCYNYTKSVNLIQRVKQGKKVKELINVKEDAVVANFENTKRRRRKENNEGSG